MSVGPGACIRVAEAHAAGMTPDPNDVRDCERWRQIITTLEELLVIRFFPPPFPPPIGPIRRIPDLIDPAPQPNLDFNRHGVEGLFLGELVLDRLRQDPTPTPTLFNKIRESGAYEDVLERMIGKFESAADELKEELQVLKQQNPGKSQK